MRGPALAAAIAALGAPALAAASPAAGGPVGHVVEVTGARAYLDAGADEGLAAGDELQLWRGEAPAGGCRVELVAPAHATCVGAGARAGDAFHLPPPPAGPVAPPALPPVPDPTELARRAARVAAAPVALVEYRPPPGVAATLPAAAAPPQVGEVSLSDQAWTASPGGTYRVEEVDGAIHGLALGGGATFDLDLSAQRWLAQSGPVFLPGRQSRLDLWQAQIGWAPAGGPFALAAGRILPWAIPGATVMDGAMASLRGDAGEAGLFGGLVPEPDTLSPTSSRATAGGFWSTERRWGSDLVLREEGRLAVVVSPELGTRAELEDGVALHAGSALDLFADARVGAGGLLHAPGYLDGARIEADWRPVSRLFLDGGFEYGGLAVPQLFVPPAFGSLLRRGDATATLDLWWVRAGATGGFAHDAATGIERSWAGPQLEIPRFVSPAVALLAGYLEERGWLSGRSAYLQASAALPGRLRLVVRGSWSHEASLGFLGDAVDLSTSLDAPLGDRFGLRLTAMGRLGLDATGLASAATPSGVDTLATFYALF